MSEVHLNVRLLEMTDNAVSLIYTAARQCYSPRFAGALFEEVTDKAKQACLDASVGAAPHRGRLFPAEPALREGNEF